MSATLQDGFEPHTAAPQTQVHPFFWCVRRELWENRFIFVAPVAVAMLVVGAYLVGTVHLPQIMRANPHMNQGGAPPAGLPFTIASVSVVLTATIAGVFYALGALYNERRDRSILFWKSLPISDRTVVLAKAFIPLVMLPLVALAVTLVMQLVMLGLAAAFSGGGGIPAFWTQWPFFQMAVVIPYCFIVTVLWQAPLWGWLFMVSAWAKRAPFLWAFLPPLALAIAEKVAFDSAWLCSVIFDRFTGAFDAAFVSLNNVGGPIPLDQIAPLKFVTSPGLWIGLVVAAGFFAAAIRLRRFQGPL